MHKLAPVEEAKTLFREARDWSVWRWLIEKRRARSTADAAWAALEACEEKVKAGWVEEWQQAYRDLSADGRPKARRGAPRAAGLDPEIKEALERLHEADIEASQAHEAAEAQFDEADRKMSGSMACEGAQMAIDAWEMREKVIRKAEALGRRK
jgi:transposase